MWQADDWPHDDNGAAWPQICSPGLHHTRTYTQLASKSRDKQHCCTSTRFSWACLSSTSETGAGGVPKGTCPTCNDIPWHIQQVREGRRLWDNRCPAGDQQRGGGPGGEFQAPLYAWLQVKLYYAHLRNRTENIWTGSHKRFINATVDISFF